MKKTTISVSCRLIAALLFIAPFTSFSQTQKKSNAATQKIIKTARWGNMDIETIKANLRKDGVSEEKINKIIEQERKNGELKSASDNQMWKQNEPIVHQSSCANSDIGVEGGTFATWTGQSGCVPSNPCGWTTQTMPYCAGPPGSCFAIVSAANNEPCDNPANPLPLPSPWGGNFSIHLGDHDATYYSEKLIHTFVVQPTDSNFIYQYAVVFEDPGHGPADQPFFEFLMRDALGNIIPCSYQKYTAGAALPGFYSSASCSGALYKPWTIVGVNLGPYVGQQVTVECTNADCGLGGHFGDTYLDFSCGTLASSTQFCVGEDSVLLCAPYEPGFTYAWSTGGSTSCIIANPQIDDTVTCYLNPPSGCGFWLVYNLLPTNISPGFTYTINCNNSVTFTDTSGITGGTITGWQWNFPGATPSSFNGQNPGSVVYPAPGTYTVTLEITSQANCKDTTIGIPITILPPPTVLAGPNASICPGGSATLCASGGVTYVWQPGNAVGTCITVNPAGTTNYTVVATDANGCTAVGNTTVTLNTPPAITASGGQICANACTTIVGAGGVSYVWTPTTGLSCVTCASPTACPPGPLTYTVIGTDANGCTNTATASVSILPNPTIGAGPNATLCYGRDTVMISATGGASYVWSPAVGLSCTNCPNPWAYPLFSNTYTVTGTDANGCTNVATVAITVGAIPFVSAIAPTTICNGDSAQLFANTSNGLQPYSYYWFPPNDLNNPNLQNPTAGPPNSTPYTVIVTDANGCTDDTTTYVYVQTVPSVTWASWTPKLTCDGIVMPFLANASSNAQTVYLNFGDGTTVTIPVTGDTISIPHTYPYGSTYSVTLVVFNPPCSDTLDTTMVVSDVMQFINILPSNVFTPNGDGLNDCFHPSVCDISAITPSNPCPKTPLTEELKSCLTMEIYDRWGIKMFETTDSEKCWDGKNLKGNDAVEGTYYYIYQFGEMPLRGYLTLLRKTN